MTQRLPRQLFSTFRPPPQVRYGTVTSVSTGICTVKVAGGEIPVITINGAPVNVGDFVAVQRQGPASYLLAVPSGAIWLAANFNAGTATDMAAVRCTTSGSQAIVPFGPTGVQHVPWGASAGPKGSVWFTFGEAQVWSVQGTAVSSFPLGANAQAYGLVLGPEGSMWICDSINGGLWSVAPNGAVAFLALPSGPFGAASPYAVAVGPDSALYLTDTANEGVWRVVPPGGAAFYPSPAGLSSGLLGVCSGGGYLWVPDEYTNYVWRVTTGGNFTPFNLSSLSPTTLSLAVFGKDGNLYITDQQPRVIQMAMDGSAVSIPLTQGPAYGVCVGPDGNIWVAVTNGEASGAFLLGVKGGSQFADYTLGTLAQAIAVSQICAGP